MELIVIPRAMVNEAKTKKMENDISKVCSTELKSLKNVENATCKQNPNKLSSTLWLCVPCQE